MSRVDECLEKLITAVLESEEYQRYREVEEKIKLEPEKERAIHNFRKRNFMLQRNKDNVDLFDEIDKLEQELVQFRQEPLVDDYLTSELAVCRLVQKINLNLMERIEFDLGYFDQ